MNGCLIAEEVILRGTYDESAIWKIDVKRDDTGHIPMSRGRAKSFKKISRCNDGVYSVNWYSVNSKFEARNPKQIQMTKIKNSKNIKILLDLYNLLECFGHLTCPQCLCRYSWQSLKVSGTPRLLFCPWSGCMAGGYSNFDIVSSFDIRISDFEVSRDS